MPPSRKKSKSGTTNQYSGCKQWIRQPSIAAEKRGMDEGCDLTMRMLRDAGFGEVTKVPTDGTARHLRYA